VTTLGFGEPVMRNLITVILFSIAVLTIAPGAQAQVPEAATMAWPDKSSSSVVFTSRVVWNMDKALDFYVQALGMQRVGGFSTADKSAQEVFLAFTDTPDSVKVALLQQSKNTEPLPHPDGYSHIVIQVPDIKAVLTRIPSAGGKIVGELHHVAAAKTWIAMTEDPDGHKVELLQRD
tara:strand:- start:732 stop:1262 length:531 start_codon:yes stop_codon:yes gene_type:complete